MTLCLGKLYLIYLSLNHFIERSGTITNSSWKNLSKIRITLKLKFLLKSNYILYKKVTFDRKYPKWMNFKITSTLKKRSEVPQKYYKNPPNENNVYFHAHSHLCSEMII